MKIKSVKTGARGNDSAKPCRSNQAMARIADTYRLDPGLVVLDGESSAAFMMLRDALNAEFKPSGPMAAILVDYAACVIWRLRRVATFEAGLLSWIADQQRQQHDRQGIRLGDIFVSGDVRALQSPGRTGGELRRQRHGRQVLGRSLEAALDKSDPLGKIGRYEGHLMRQLGQTLQQLRRLGCEHGSGGPPETPCGRDPVPIATSVSEQPHSELDANGVQTRRRS